MHQNNITKVLVLASSICLVTLFILYRAGKLKYSFPGDEQYAEMLEAEPLPLPVVRDTTIPKKDSTRKLLLSSSKSMQIVPVDNPLLFPPKTKKKEPVVLKTILSNSKSIIMFKPYTPPIFAPLDSVKIDTSLFKSNQHQ